MASGLDPRADGQANDRIGGRTHTLKRSIRLRNPYVDPMSVLQVDLLRRCRETDRRDDDLFRALVASVQGIARGLKNTG